MYGIYINCRRVPFIDLILSLLKPYETRTRNVFRPLIGQTVYLIETGRGAPMVKGIAVIESDQVVPFDDEQARQLAKIAGTEYDIKPYGTKVFYKLSQAKKVNPFPVPTDRINHGRSFTEF